MRLRSFLFLLPAAAVAAGRADGAPAAAVPGGSRRRLETTHNWVLSDKGQSCTNACTSDGGTCVVASMRSVDRFSRVQVVAGLLGFQCTNIMVGSYIHTPSVYEYGLGQKTCWYSSVGVSTCDAIYFDKRMCCCGDNCPTEEALTDEPTKTPTGSPTTSPTDEPTKTPTGSPTTSPTMPGPLTLDYVDTKADFTSDAANELEVGYLVGVGHEVTAEVFETCDANAAEVPPSLYNAEGKDMVSQVPGSANTTHTKIIVAYNFNKTQMTTSANWDSGIDEFTFCQVISLTIPSPTAGDVNWVIMQDRRNITLGFDLEAEIILNVDLAGGTITNTTQTVDFDKDMDAYKCSGGVSNSFVSDPTALPPNTELAICLKINNDAVNIDDVTQMTIDQDDKTLSVITNSGAVVPQITKKRDVPQEGFIVKTMVPINKFDFESNKSLNITGAVELKLVGSSQGRKLRVLIGENDVAEEEVQRAGYDVTVNLKSSADDFEPLGSSDGHAIAGKAFLWFLVVAAVVFVV